MPYMNFILVLIDGHKSFFKLKARFAASVVIGMVMGISLHDWMGMGSRIAVPTYSTWYGLAIRDFFSLPRPMRGRGMQKKSRISRSPGGRSLNHELQIEVLILRDTEFLCDCGTRNFLGFSLDSHMMMADQRLYFATKSA
jgi:hypothetical protein